MIPYPLVSGGRVRVYNLLKRIATRHEVWLACHLHSPEEVEGVEHMRSLCGRVATGLLRRESPMRHLPGIARYALQGWPPELKFLHSPELARTLDAWCREVTFDVVQVEESRMALYLESLPDAMRSVRVMTFYDVAFDQSARIAAVEGSAVSRARSRLHAAVMRRWEPRYAERFDRCIVVSEQDRQRLALANPRLAIDVVPNGVDTAAYLPLGWEHSEPRVMFIGNMSYRPCIDAANTLVGEILPIVRRELPEVGAYIVGSGVTDETRALASAAVTVTGQVEDVRPYYARSMVCVVPLRAGGGTRLKILESMALGRPVVSTTLGCEGLDVTPGEHLLVADDPREMAAGIVRLLTDHGCRDRFVTSARRLVAERYDWDGIAERQLALYADLVQESVSEGSPAETAERRGVSARETAR